MLNIHEKRSAAQSAVSIVVAGLIALLAFTAFMTMPSVEGGILPAVLLVVIFCSIAFIVVGLLKGSEFYSRYANKDGSSLDVRRIPEDEIRPRARR